METIISARSADNADQPIIGADLDELVERHYIKPKIDSNIIIFPKSRKILEKPEQPDWNPDAFNDLYIAKVDKGLMEDIKNNIPRKLGLYKDIILTAAHHILGLKRYIQDFKWKKSQENGDIGYKAAVHKFITNESETYQKIMGYNRPKNFDRLSCGKDNFNRFMKYLLLTLDEDENLKKTNAEINQNKPHNKDELGALPFFLKSKEFSYFVHDNMKRYCLERCSYEPHCVTVKNLPRNNNHKKLPSEYYFG